MTTYHRHYANRAELLTAIARPAKPDADTKSYSYSRSGWTMGMQYPAAVAALTDGWSKGAERAQVLAESLNVSPTAERRSHRPAITGARPIVPRFLAGSPKAMMRPCMIEGSGPLFLTLYVPIGFSCAIKDTSAFDYGVAMLALIDALESSNVRTQVVAWSGVSGANAIFTNSIVIKEHQEPAQVSDLMFMVAHPAMFRRCVFRLYENDESAEVRGLTSQSYGRPRQCKVTELHESDDWAVVLPFLATNNRDAQSWIPVLVDALPQECQARLIGE